jgi:serine/threonine protein kinase/Tfp pilus assembly protein PilF
MVRLRSVIVVLIAAAILYALVIGAVSSFQFAPAAHRVGATLDNLRLGMAAAPLLQRAASIYAVQLAASLEAGREPSPLAKSKARAYERAVLDLAEAHFHGGRPAAAEPVLQKAKDLLSEAQADPTAVLTALGRARVLQGGAKSNEGQKTLLLALQQTDDKKAIAEIDYWLAQAYLGGEDADVAEAVALLEEANQARPRHFGTLLSLGKALLKQEDKQSATKYLQQALAVAPTVRGRLVAAKALKEAGARAPAVPLLVAGSLVTLYWKSLLLALVAFVLLFRPALWRLVERRLHAHLGNVYLRQGRRDVEAIELYRQMLQRQPNRIDLAEVVAEDYLRMDPTSGSAEDIYRRILESHPDHPNAVAGLGNIFLRRGRRDPEAIALYHKWFALRAATEELGELAGFLASVYQEDDAMEEAAIPIVERAVAVGRADPQMKYYLGSLYHHFGQDAKGIQIMESVVEESPEDEKARDLLARCYVGEKKYYLAYRYLKALPINEETTSALYVTAVGCEQEGLRKQALRIFQEVVRREATFADAQTRVENLSREVDPNRVGPYLLQAAVSEAEVGRLYRAVGESGDIVALRVVDQDISDALLFPQRFHEQMPKVKAFQHDTVVPVVDYGEADGTCYVAMDLVIGRDLSKILEEYKQLSFYDAACIVTEVLRGLSAAHEAGLLHGDIRPENVIVTEEGQVKVMGFGICDIAGSALGADRASSVRSPAHLAPEIVQKRPADQRSDIYSVGCLLYQMLTGEPPFAAASRLATMMEHVTTAPVPPTRKVRSLFPEVDQLTLRAMAKEPSERFESAAEMRRALIRAAGISERKVKVELRKPEAQVAPGAHWWDRFEEIDPIARAHMAQVYRGVDRLAREVRVIKEVQIPGHIAGAGGSEKGAKAMAAIRRLFLNETHVVRALAPKTPDEPRYVVQFWEAFAPAEGVEPAYSMELLYETLADAETRDIARQLCLAVQSMHEKGFVHRNIKPSAIMFSRDNELRLVGFDHACRLADVAAVLAAERTIIASAQSPTDVVGDVRYRSPEHCRTEAFDQRSDIYAIGCVIYEMLTGKPPFAAPDPMATMLQHITQPPPPMQREGAPIPADLAGLVARALQKNPDDRFQDVGEMARQLASGDVGAAGQLNL